MQESSIINLERLSHSWQAKYPECEPIPELLRQQYADRWVRFHTLPDSKRYPATSEEYAIVIQRHNKILAALNPGAQMLLLTSEWGDRRKNRLERDVLSPKVGQPDVTWKVLPENPNPDQSKIAMWRYIHISLIRWSSGALDQTLRKVADDEISGVLVSPVDFDWLYHPYDGGADVIARSTKERDNLKNQFSAWASPTASGL
jgi:hypothetical protein